MAIRKTITVPSSADVAFRAFTADIGKWWPLQQFSFGGERAKGLHMEGHAGGRFYERFTDGEEFQIGVVVVYEPPVRVVFTWHQPGWAAPTEVEVRFVQTAGGTRVELEHRGWEAAGLSKETMGGYDQGWGFILSLFGKSQAA